MLLRAGRFDVMEICAMTLSMTIPAAFQAALIYLESRQ